MSNVKLNEFFQYGTNAERLAFTPSPASGVQPIYVWYETDTDEFYIYTSAWKGPYTAASGAGSGQKYSLTPDGTTTVFSLAATPSSDAHFLLFWNGVLQAVTDDYTRTGSSLTTVFTAAASDKLTYVIL